MVMGAAAAGVAATLYVAADWLRGNSKPSAADFIVVLAGTPERSLYAAELYKAGYARIVLVSRPVREPSLVVLDSLGIAFPLMEDVYRQVLERSGVPSDHVSVFGKGAFSTYDEARTLSKMFGSGRPRLLVVTSPYHVRRAALILRDVVGAAAGEITVVGTPHESFPTRWWTDQGAARNVLLELAKIAFYRFGGRFAATDH
jgi:uncharacterized SAM-binding protein YcdF (DUF218 family)